MSTFTNTNLAFTTPEHWGNNDDLSNNHKPKKSLKNQIAKTPLGRGMQLYAEDSQASNTPMNPEEILIAQEEGYFDKPNTTASPLDYLDYEDDFVSEDELLAEMEPEAEEVRRVLGNTLITPTDLQEQIERTESKRKKLNFTESDIRRENIDLRRKNGDRQSPSKQRCIERKSTPKKLQSLITQQTTNRDIEEVQSEIIESLGNEEYLLAGENATPKQLKQWNQYLSDEEDNIEFETGQINYYDEQSEKELSELNLARVYKEEYELMEEISELRANIKYTQRDYDKEYDECVSLEMEMEYTGECYSHGYPINQAQLDEKWRLIFNDFKALDKEKKKLIKLESKLMRGHFDKPNIPVTPDTTNERAQLFYEYMKVLQQKKKEALAEETRIATTNATSDPLFNIESVQAKMDRLAIKDFLDSRPIHEEGKHCGDRQLRNKRISRKRRKTGEMRAI